MRTVRLCVAIAPLATVLVLLSFFACSLRRTRVHETPTPTQTPTATLTPPTPTATSTPKPKHRKLRRRKRSVTASETPQSEEAFTPALSPVSTPSAGSSTIPTPPGNARAYIPQLPLNPQATGGATGVLLPAQAEAQRLLDRASKRLSGINQAQLKDYDLEYYQQSAGLISDSRAALEEKEYAEARALALKALQLLSQISVKPPP